MNGIVHKRKIRTRWYDDVRSGLKTWEVRINDRPEGFRVGDLIELDPVYDNGSRCANAKVWPPLRVEITYVAADVPGLDPNYVVLGIEVVK